jgi:DNA-binding XRE family transcriptional regulator
MAHVLLLTDRAAFESSWSAGCLRLGLSVRCHELSEVARAIEQATAIVIDGDSERLDARTLLAYVGLARAHGVVVGLGLPADGRLRALDDLLLELCGGLVARSPEDVPRVCAGLLRRSDPAREARFEHLAQTASSDELLAILGDGSATLVERPFSPDDRGELPVESITLAEDRRSARICLRDGTTLELIAAELAQGRLAGARNLAEGASALGDVDGVRLGQRLRALRLAAGLTQAELAKRTGIHRPNIARVEAGRHTPSLETLARLAAAIGVKTERVIAD